MNKEETQSSIYSILNEVIEGLDVVQSSNKPKIDNNSVLQNDLGLDSLSLAELAVRIEMKFGVDVFENLVPITVGDVINELNISD
jgi:acyl carrier protein